METWHYVAVLAQEHTSQACCKRRSVKQNRASPIVQASDSFWSPRTQKTLLTAASALQHLGQQCPAKHLVAQ